MSNNELQTLMLVMWPLMAASGVCLYLTILAIRNHFKLMRRQREYASLKPSSSEALCKGPHTWDTIKLALAGLPVDTYMVCSECGLVSTQEASVQLNGPALEIYRNELKIRQRRNNLQSRMDQKRRAELDRLMNTMVKSVYVELGSNHDHVKVLQQFFRKTVLEVDSLYARLNKEIEEEEGRG